ncbi:MAG: haloacid dehalogenase type II [Betaproteobacteria bacterium]|nr:haloacid dehalogenase type II [Betaproteobacteria bacterium]
MSTPTTEAVVFDAYGTLFDVYSVTARCEALFPGHGRTLAQLWRTKQLEYTWLRSLMGRYENFEVITRDALRVAATSMGLALNEANTQQLLDEYLVLAPFPEVAGVIGRLGRLKRCILSNGTPRFLAAVVGHAGLRFDQVISVDPLRVYKPHPTVYQMGVDTLHVPKDRIAFISSNFWDISGATAFGFQTYWINRAGTAPDELGYRPIATLRTLDDLVDLI